MPEDQTQPLVLTPKSVLDGISPLVLTATLKPIGGLDRFQPAGFPEIGHVIYKAPRQDGHVENVCIVDSPASMANHLEAVCLRGPHDLELDDNLAGMPYLRCVTGNLADKKLPPEKRELVVTSLTEGHRIASDYFLKGRELKSDNEIDDEQFGGRLMKQFKAQPLKGENAYLPPAGWWDVFRYIYHYDPNALAHGVLFPKWQIKIARFLTAHLEAFGAARVDRSGVKFDRLGKTTSGQPIFAVDDETASEIRATFIFDVALLRSFGRTENGSDGEKVRGLSEKQKEFVAALALWKIDRLLKTPFRYRSGCHLELVSLKYGEQKATLDVNIKNAINSAKFRDDGDQAPIITDIYWPHDELYREAEDDNPAGSATENNAGNDSDDEEGDGEDA
ncbi:MAG: type I-G CRISPR-associated protein Cas7 [Terriglobales bacterium]